MAGKPDSESLRASWGLFDAVFRQSPIGIAMISLDGMPMAVNPAMCRMLGYREDELIGRSILEVTAPQFAAATVDSLRRLGADDSPGTATFEHTYVHKQGHLVWGIVSVYLQRDSAGAPEYFITHIQDVTPRKRAEAILRESEEKFRIAFENAPMGMSIVDGKGRFVAVNPALCRMFGYRREALLAGAFNDLTHPDDIERGTLWMRKMMSGDNSEPDFEKRYVHQDGHVVWGLVRAEWVRNDDGSPRMSVVHVLDITERKRAEEALRARERRLREAHEIAQMGDWVIELPDGAMHWSQGIYRLFELSPAATQPSREAFLSWVHPEDRAAVLAADEAAVVGHQSSDIVHRLLFADGRIKHVRRISRVERSSDGKPLRMIGIIQDITTLRQADEQRAQLEEQLQRARRMEAIGYLAGGVAHDFNNLLTVIGGNASLALLDAHPSSKLASLLDEISQGVASAAELTRQLLTFSRRQVIAPKVIDLNEHILRLGAMLRRLLGEDLTLDTVLDPELGHVRFDVSQAEQILINLAVNARDAMVDGGTLTIRTANVELHGERRPDHGTARSGPFVMLEVTDTGTGMSEDTKQHLFEPFFTTKEQGRGAGLGLAMVYGAVEQNHGHIDVWSEVGQGTSLKIFLPRVDLPLEASETASAARESAGRETILFVEDDHSVRALGERVLSRQGYRVHAFANGGDVLAAAASLRDPVDLLVTDVVMPGMNGRALADELRRLLPSLKVLFTSGYTQDVIANHGALEAGVEFLPKPYSAADLSQKVRDVLGRRA